MTMIAAKPSYKPPKAPEQYDPQWWQQQLASIARALTVPKTRIVFAATTVTPSDDTIICDATAAPFTVTFPVPDQVQHLKVTVKKIDVSANAVTLGATVDGAANPTLAAQYKSKTVQSDGTRYNLLASV